MIFYANDCGDTYNNPTVSWDYADYSGGSGAFSILVTTGRSGNCIATYGGGGPAGLGTWQNRFGKTFSNRATLFNAFAFKITALPPRMQNIVAFFDGVTSQVDLQLNTSGQIVVTRNGTTLATSTHVLSTGVWHAIEWGTTIHATAGTVSVKVDGVVWSELTLTSQNTKATSNAYANWVYYGWLVSDRVGSVSAFYYDDIVLYDDTGTGNNTFGAVGDATVGGLLASGNGTVDFTATVAGRVASTAYAYGATILDSNSNLQRCITLAGGTTGSGAAPTWNTTVGLNTTDGGVTFQNIGTLSAYKAVNEPNGDGDSSYVSDNTVGHVARFTYPLITSAGAVVKAVQLGALVDKDLPGTRTYRLQAKSGATTVDNGTDIIPFQGVYQFQTAVFEVDPNTSAAWTFANIAAAEFGVVIES